MIRLFFFSSRRRHTRCSRDWSSDVCSSDLILESFVQGAFVDANESLAVIFERLEKPGDPKVRIHRDPDIRPERSEEHTSELQSRLHLVCRLLLEKKKKKTKDHE